MMIYSKYLLAHLKNQISEEIESMTINRMKIEYLEKSLVLINRENMPTDKLILAKVWIKELDKYLTEDEQLDILIKIGRKNAKQ